MKCPHSFVMKAPGGKPVYMRMEYGGPMQILQGVVVPCGRCIICRKNKAAEWAARISHEMEYHAEKCFITLTYSDDNIPKNENDIMTLNKRDVQLFMKRLRKNTEKKIKYFVCGEYGENTSRPHYHAIILGWRPDLNDLTAVSAAKGRKIYSSGELSDYWKNGNVQVGSVTQDSVYYVTGYIIKKLNKEVLDGRTPEFLLCSRGIGLNYALDNIEKVRKGELLSNGSQTAIPKYYIKKVGVDKRYMLQRAIDSEVVVKTRKGITDYNKLRISVQNSRKQCEIDQEKLKDISKRSVGPEI